MRRKPREDSEKSIGDSQSPKEHSKSFKTRGDSKRPMVRNNDPAWSQPTGQSDGYDFWTRSLGEQARFEAETKRIEAEGKAAYLKAEAQSLLSNSPGRVGSLVQAVSQVFGLVFIVIVLLVLLV